MIPCSKFIIPKIRLKNKVDCFSKFLSKNNCVLKSNEIIDLLNSSKIRSNFEQSIEKDEGDLKFYSGKNESFSDKNICLEDIMTKIQKNNLTDYKVFNDIIWFLNEDFDYDQNVNLSIYRDDLIYSTIKKYKYLFNIIIEPTVK